MVALLQRKGGATIAEIMAAIGWQRHSVRALVAGAIKKAGYSVESDSNPSVASEHIGSARNNRPSCLLWSSAACEFTLKGPPS